MAVALTETVMADVLLAEIREAACIVIVPTVMQLINT